MKFVLGAKVIYDKEIFAIDVPQPKNYTLIFKYIGSESSPNITYAIFNVNTVSNSQILGNNNKVIWFN